MSPASNVPHSIFQKLRNRAKERKDDFNLLLLRYAMERMLFRLGESQEADSFVLKGASLFLVWKGQNYRVTKDADFLAFGEPSLPRIEKIFRELCTLNTLNQDGMQYNPESVRVEEIREDNAYDGIRVTLQGRLGNARIGVQIDIGFGDAITPEPESIEYPSLLSAPAPKLMAYPRYTMVAEKVETMVSRGLANSRMKDFYDIWLVSQLFEFEKQILATALTSTFTRRKTEIPNEKPFALTADFYEDPSKQMQWKAFLRKAKPQVDVAEFGIVVEQISDFIWPVLKPDESVIRKGVWLPNIRWSKL